MNSMLALAFVMGAAALACRAPVPPAPPAPEPSIADYDAPNPAALRARLDLGEYRIAKGDLVGALSAADSALAMAPTSGAARLLRAEVLAELGLANQDEAKLEEARGIMTAARAEHPEHPGPQWLEARIALGEGHAPVALERLEVLVAERPNWAKAHALRAGALLESGRLLDALAATEQALALAPGEPRTLKVRLAALLLLGDPFEVRGVLTATARARPDDPVVRQDLVFALISSDQTARARALLVAIPEERRRSTDSWLLAQVERNLGNADAAREALDAALEAGAPELRVAEERVALDLAERSAARGLEWLERHPGLAPETAPYLSLRAPLLLDLGRRDEARDALRRALRLDPALSSVWVTLGRLLRESEGTPLERARAALGESDGAFVHVLAGMASDDAGDPATARREYEAALALDPSNPTAQNNLAYLLATAGDEPERAIELARGACSSLPGNGASRDTLGYALLHAGRAQEASLTLQEALRGWDPLHPATDEVRIHLAEALARLGQRELATRIAKGVLFRFEPLLHAARWRGGEEPPTPPWVSAARNLLHELDGPSPGEQRL